MFVINGMIVRDEMKEINGVLWRKLSDANATRSANWCRAIPIEDGDERLAVEEAEIVTREGVDALSI